VPNPVLLCGLGKIGARVLEILRTAGLPVVAVDLGCNPNDPRWQGMQAIRGDCREPQVLEQAGVRNARAVLIVTSNDLINTSAALAVRRLNPSVRIVVRMFNPNLLARLGKAVGNVQALSVSALTAPLLAYTAITGEVLGAFSVNGERQQIAKLVMGNDSTLIGRTVSAVAAEFKVLPLAREGAGRPAELLLQVRGDEPLQIGDSLVVCGPPDDLAQLLPLGETAEWENILPGVRWAGKVRRVGRVIWRALAEIDLAVKICTAVLLFVVVGSTVFFFSTGMSAPDALYRTISVIATGADMQARSDEHKIFVSFLRVFGAVLTAAFTAIVTNFLLRARLGGALEIRRIPDSGHIVVCGLGNVGFRVVEELLKCQERVVVLERARDNPFIGTCRRLGAAVIVGDSVVPEVLRQARVGTSRAVVAATSDDLVNLEIALLARELNPKQRVVVRLADDALAETLREVVDVRLALSLPNLAAPAFVAALYGDRVHSLFRINRRMLAAVELTVQPGDPCLKDQTLHALAIDYGLLPVTAGDANRRLKEGEQLTAVGTMAQLEPLFRRQPAVAEWHVEVTNVPELAKGPVAQLVRLENGIGGEEAEKSLQTLPLRVGRAKTLGQAEELRALLERERAVVNLTRS
jgi:Trk K+ transport system NAD-binding subunit